MLKSNPPSDISILSEPLNLIGCYDNINAKFAKKKKKKKKSEITY